ncbi:DUF4340 domain-containing protein [uncultured Treponema sp.]|uniref:DUF4340 domain-containing protein n=1 Tax=uncultured Treponema sp. TaxID=162155 RepID=UPI0025F06B83|nr:DUF4340 domain-containing protein [uncultured Treponema sp.]
MKKIDCILLKILPVSIILFALSLVFSPERANSQKAEESAVLNQKYRNEVRKIVISRKNADSTDELLEMTRHGDFYLLSDMDSKITCLANSKLISSLLENAVKIRKFYRLSQKSSDAEKFLTDESSSIVVSFYASGEEPVSKIYFGAEDALKNRIYLRSHKSNVVYECENDFHQYLNTELDYWAEGKIFAEAENPVQIGFEILSENEKLPETKKIDEKSGDFQKKSAYLLELRHGKIVDMIPSSAKKISVLSVYSGNGRISRLDFYEVKNGMGEEEQESYFYTKSVIPSQIDGQENSFAFYSENAVYEVSAWTFGRICDLF